MIFSSINKVIVSQETLFIFEIHFCASESKCWISERLYFDEHHLYTPQGFYPLQSGN